jgi:hypothetical protein
VQRAVTASNDCKRFNFALMVHMTTNALSIPGHRYVPGCGLKAWAFRDPNTLRRRAGLRKKLTFHHGFAKGQCRPVS